MRIYTIITQRGKGLFTHPEFSDSLARGKVPADAEVAATMFKRAIGYEQPAVKIFMPAGADAPVYADYMEHYPGDVAAQQSWLLNRQGHIWKDRQHVDMTGTMEHRIAAMTPEERARDAIELVERVRARLAVLRSTIAIGRGVEVVGI